MIPSIIIFLPLAVCLFWMFIHCVMASRTSTFAAFMCLLCSTAIFLFSDCCYYNPATSRRLLTFAHNLSQLSAPCVIPLLLIYISRQRNGRDIRIGQLTWVMVPIILFTVAEMLTGLAGRPAVEEFLGRLYSEGDGVIYSTEQPELRLYYYVSVVGYRIVIATEVISLLGAYIVTARRDGYRISNLRNFFFHGGKIDVAELQYVNLAPIVILSFVKLFFIRDYLQDHIWISALLSVLLTLFLFPVCHVAMFGSRKKVSLHDILCAFRYNYSPKTKTEFTENLLMDLVEEADEGTLMRLQMKYGLQLENNAPDQEEKEEPEEEKEPSLAERIFSAVTRSIDEDSLMGRFEHLMMVEKMFLQSGLTLDEVADRLNSNKTYVSKMVNSTYNISFPELVNTLRIDYAEDYLVHNRDARQEEIARACGFPSASSFNNTFKRVTGMPPRIWLATHDRG